MLLTKELTLGGEVVPEELTLTRFDELRESRTYTSPMPKHTASTMIITFRRSDSTLVTAVG